MSTLKSTLAVLAAIAIAAVLAVAAWHLGWFVQAKNVDRQTRIENGSLGRQQALTSAVLRKIGDVRAIDTQEQTEAVQAQRVAIVASICDSAGQLTGTVTFPPSAQSFINQECP